MTLTLKKSPVLFSLIVAFGSLLFVSMLPFAWRISNTKKNGNATQPGTLWTAMKDMSELRGNVRNPWEDPVEWEDLIFQEMYFHNLRLTSIVLVLGYVVGRLVSWFSWSEKAPGRVSIR